MNLLGLCPILNYTDVVTACTGDNDLGIDRLLVCDRYRHCRQSLLWPCDADKIVVFVIVIVIVIVNFIIFVACNQSVKNI